jgi:hypothetical protein
VRRDPNWVAAAAVYTPDQDIKAKNQARLERLLNHTFREYLYT